MNKNSSENKTNTIFSFEHMMDNNIEELIIPYGIHEVKERAFFQCINLKKIYFPLELTTIGASAFSGCINLEEIILPPTLKKISYRAFADCRKLKKIIIPEGVTEIDWGAFAGCLSLEEIFLPNSLTNIGKQMFLNCKNLKKITLPDNLTNLPDEFFKGCSKLNITLNKKITTLGRETFANCYNLSNYPNHIIEAGENCFKNCRKLTNVEFDEQFTYIPDGMFDGCTNLSNISSKKLITIGKKAFRNCKSLKDIPSFIANYNEQAFENCSGLTKIEIFYHDIPFACFRGCKNVNKIINQDDICGLGAFAFSGCDSLEEINLPYILSIAPETFSNCKKLKIVRLPLGTRKIGSRAFYNCQSLQEMNIPDTVSMIGKEAFKKCSMIKKIRIPEYLKKLDTQAFSYMDSLEQIEVAPGNKTYMTPDNKILVHILHQSIELYPAGLKEKSYLLENYNVEYDALNRSIIKPINGIKKYAFAGNKYLEELSLCCCTVDIECTAWIDCPNLKTLKIIPIPFFTIAGIKLRDNNRYYISEFAKTKADIPFEKVIFENGEEENICWISQEALKGFDKVTEIILPSRSSYNIFRNAFDECINLKQIYIPKNVIEIDENSFSPNTILNFENGLKITGLKKLSNSDDYIGKHKLYSLYDGTYYIEQDGKIITITKEQINKTCSHPEEIIDNPVLYLDFINDIYKHDLNIDYLFNGILFANMSIDNRQILFDYLKKDDTFALNVIKNSKILEKKDNNTLNLLSNSNFQKVIDYIELLKKYNITEPLLHHKFLIANYDIESLERLINFDLELLIKTIKYSKLFDNEEATLLIGSKTEKRESYYLTYEILRNNNLEKFIYLIKKYNIKDKYLFEKPFLTIASNPLADQLFKIYDANTKRLLKASMVTTSNISAKTNLSDLLTLMKISGALEKNELIRQRSSTFIIEKMFAKTLDNGNNNNYRIIDNDIHRIFNFNYIRKDFDEEFAKFFLENYYELINIEKQKSGFIQRVYLNFKEISKTSTSNKGHQRHLKVTINKCINYLSKVKFDGVTEENKEFAEIIGAWYDESSVWEKSLAVYSESLDAPRNIFTKIKYDKNGNPIYDDNPNNDLKEPLNDLFSFEWLPKQDYNNLILGKYCNCCAHVHGAGSGIMRASMILDNCQNLVIKNKEGTIIAKSNLFVNRTKGYGVFNNVESSLNYRSDTDLLNIYNAFIRGVRAFINEYNKNNVIQLKEITIGSNRNTILSLLESNNHEDTEIHQSINFSEYSLSGSNYNGDWEKKQKLVIKI